MTTGDLNYQIYLPLTTFQPLQNVSLTIAPLIGTALSTTQQFDATSNNTTVNLFYLTGDSTSTNIARADLSCAGDSPSCTTTSNTMVTTSTIANPVHFSSTLSALYLGPSGYRIFYTTTSNALGQLASTSNPGVWKSGVVTGTSIAEGGGIATALSPPLGMNIFYTSDSTELTIVNWKSGTGFSAPAVVGASTPNLGATSPLTASFAPGSGTLEVFYLGGDGSVNSWLKQNTTTSVTWTAQTPSPFTKNADVNSGVTAVAWSNKERLYYFVAGVMNEVSGSVASGGMTTWENS
jgi:hypothetical protein